MPRTGLKRGIRQGIEAAAVICLCILLLSAAFLNKDYGSQMDYGPVTGKGHKQYSVREEALALLPQTYIKIGFAQAGHESDWRIAVTDSCMKTFCEENGYQLYFVDADGSPGRQVSAVRNFIQEQVDYILIDPIIATGWTAVLKEAYHAKIPVIILNGRIDCRQRYYKAWYGPDYILEGECAGQWLYKTLSRMGQNGGLKRILLMNGTSGMMEQSGRMEGFAKYMERNRNWKILTQSRDHSGQNTVRQMMADCLEQYTDIDVILCQNDHVALEVCSSLDEAGLPYGADGGIIILSFGASYDGLKAVYQGKLNAAFECSPLAPYYAQQAVRSLESGEMIEEKHNYLPEECFALDGSMYLLTSSAVKKVIPVTEELLNDKKIKSK